MSDVLPPNDTSSSIISPVISSTTDCQSCPTTNLTSVTVKLRLQDNVRFRNSLVY